MAHARPRKIPPEGKEINLMQCPKCRGNMRTYERNGVHIEQCENCRGIFLDYGELETLTRMESQYHTPPAAPPPPHGAPAAPAWGAPAPHYGGGHYGHRRKKDSFLGMLFSS
ncbi:TFIIB-type zinc ribbon-containing protein [Nonomuraea africana]|uniref:Zn-finger nucleic acid-binding protein n=1 Tax=Nonomuraea africana TaxID=46171 RepID=A0ABR9KGJ8_9ACTN|nr:Zn-finger nucleic acid-binding protein [Nonomuraea africana]